MWRVIRGLGFILAGGVISVGLNAINYDRYWNKTIRGVQTVDFNILSHTLPTKLSELLIQQNTAEIDRTINSNHGLFGIVVTDCIQETTDCPGQTILYMSESYYDDDDEVKIADIQGQPFNILRDPPPLYPEWEFDSPHATEQVPLNLSNPGRSIGRVYYLRKQPPSFISDLTIRFDSVRDLLHIYPVTLGLCIASSLVAWLLLEEALRNAEAKEQEIERRESIIRDYEQRLQRSINRRRSLETTIRSLETTIRNTSEQLEAEIQRRENLEIRASELQSEIGSVPDQATEGSQEQLQQELEQTRSQAQNQTQTIESLQANIESLQANIEATQTELAGEYRDRAEMETWLIGEIERLENRLRNSESEREELRHRNFNLEQLVAHSPRLGVRNSDSEGRELLNLFCTERDLYSGEIRHVLLESLRRVPEQEGRYANNRRKHILRDIIDNNPLSSEHGEILNDIERLFRVYEGMDQRIRGGLSDLGISDKLLGNNHYQLLFREDQEGERYIITISAGRGGGPDVGNRIITDIRNLWF